MDEPGFFSIRTDPAAYADHALHTIPGYKRIDTDRQGYIRDALQQAFESGEHQGVYRAIQILAIAKANARTDEAHAALSACLQLLIGEPRD